ncbi:uncharacterized protein LOC130625885 [Hydractinia symbiolongicarpus]|uniref:uncharacterized protein LOC130625885 n=1 Tax=Hydractinia symbiolongicarpus TaxID=13093 RepID=UPI00254B56FB|nr:uncharacterized protein LOC130625885 [Hydractinia symbiolongicarpus]XP_057296988.1 uncharacterized protein LOC130625885 [Hydractinia symbiolongicarpus]
MVSGMSYVSAILLFSATVVYSQSVATTVAPTTTPAPLNCTNIPNVPTHPEDATVNTLITSANDNIKVCNQIIPFLNAFIAKLKVKGVCSQFDEIMSILQKLESRIGIINRTLDCGLVTSVQEARNLKQMLHNDQISKRVLNGIKMRLTDVKQRLQAIVGSA